MTVRLAVLALVAVFAMSGFAREARRPLPPRRPPSAVKGNLLQMVKFVRALRAETPGPSCVDVLVAYDRPASLWAAWKGGGVTNFAADAVMRMNVAVTNSNLHGVLVFRLVGVQEVNADARGDFDGVLDAVTYGFGRWAAVAVARERTGADIVMTLIDTGSAYGTTGLSWALCDTDYEGFADYAYGVCAIRAVAESHTMTHEVGHLFGAGHSDRQLSDPGPQLFSYSSGYYFRTNGVARHTIMAYDDDGHGNVYEEAPYFSSPDVLLDDVVLGTPTNDNVRTMRVTVSQVAAFRKTRPADTDYAVLFEGSEERMGPLYCRRETVYILPSPETRTTWRGTFAGWRCRETGKRYDDGTLVFDLGRDGSSVTMTAIWE